MESEIDRDNERYYEYMLRRTREENEKEWNYIYL